MERRNTRGRPRKGARVLGPYKKGRRYRIKILDEHGRSRLESFGTEAEALKAAEAFRKTAPGRVSLENVLHTYARYLDAKGNKMKSRDETIRRLSFWHKDKCQSVADVTPKQISDFYANRSQQVATDTHRNELAEVKTFWRWLIKIGRVRKSPAEDVEPVGRRRKGKKQLRVGEAQSFFKAADKLAAKGDEGAMAALAVILLGLRSGEIRKCRVRDIDITADRVLLWVTEGKTAAAERFMELPYPLDEYLVEQAGDRHPEAWLFPAQHRSGHRGASWLRRNVRKLCDLARVPRVSVHGLRGTWATLTTDAGVAGHVVSREIGHTNQATTKGHYIASGATQRATSRRMLRVVQGGKQ
jgi:integrase